jgi:pyruvate dehydrogenase E2 component (dihydrolipoamide acetyltransferase)
MATPILMPRQGQSVESCILTEWRVTPGTPVTKGTALASIETDKATFELEAPADGVFLAKFFENGDDVPVLTCVGAIGEAGEDVSALRPGGASSGSTPAVAASSSSAPATEPVRRPPVAPVPGDAAGISPRARNRAARLGFDPPAGIGTGPGGRILERDVLDAVRDGGRLTPAARAAHGAGTPGVSGTGIGGRIRGADLTAAPAPEAASGAFTEIPVRGIRKLIADRMRQSLASTAQLTLCRRFDASAVVATRAWIKGRPASENVPNSTINDILLYVLARTLARHPEMNAHGLGDRIRQFSTVNLGVAVDTPRGLMVPVVRDAQTLSLAELTLRVRALSEACQKGSVSPDALTGGTFTLTTLGALGVEFFTPVLNAPEVAILGVGGITQTPVPDGSAAGFRFVPMLSLSLTLDHQAVDGAPGARFLQELANGLERLEDPGLRPGA